jgi:Protein of unknown function (DUF1064)
MSRWSEADLARVSLKLRQAVAQPLEPTTGFQKADRRRKYRNKPLHFQGQNFDSQREFEKWKDFELQRIAGAIRSVIRQVSMPLPGTSRRIRVDFLVIEPDGKHVWYDAKGFETEAWRLKRQQVFDAYGITIHLI